MYETGDGLGPAATIVSLRLGASRELVVLALLAVILVLVTTPALVVGLSLLDGSHLGRTQSWFDWSSALNLARVGSALPMAFHVWRAEEGQ